MMLMQKKYINQAVQIYFEETEVFLKLGYPHSHNKNRTEEIINRSKI